MAAIVDRIAALRSEAHSGLAKSSNVGNRAPARKANVRVPHNPCSRRLRVKQVHRPAPTELDVGVGVAAVGAVRGVRVARVARRTLVLAPVPRISPVVARKPGFPA